MNITTTDYWMFFTNENYKHLDTLKMGKWMVHFSESSREYITEMCEKAVSQDVVPEAKVATNGDVACFYLNIDEIEYHRKCINFMLENKLIRKTKSGRYYNVSFKKDIQTLTGEYGIKFNQQLKLDNFINLDTGEWNFNDHTIKVDFQEYCTYYMDKFRMAYISYMETVEKSPRLSEEGKVFLKRCESEKYETEIHMCQLCQSVYNNLLQLGITNIQVLIPDGVGEVMFTPTCNEPPLKLLRKHVGQKRYNKKISAVKLHKQLKRLHKSIYDINKATEIRIRTLEKYISEDSVLSILNISLIASELKCGIDELIE